MGHRVCALEPSNSEFAIKELVGEPYGNFGQRVHLDPPSPEGVAWMHNLVGGWMESPDSREGWGTPAGSRWRSTQE
eukprot:8202197-Karenia_brevis.AAC.1